MKVYNIVWETDGYDVDLPKEVELPDEDFNELDISEYLSDEFGFLVNSFTF